MKLQNYAGYYIGCRCFNTWFLETHEQYDNNWLLEGYRPQSPKSYLLANQTDETWTDSIKPILRKLEDITEEEMKSLVLIRYSVGNTLKTVEKVNNTIQFKTSGFTGGGIIDLSELSSYQFHYLLKMKFDLFQLIENGLALDSKTLK